MSRSLIACFVLVIAAAFSYQGCGSSSSRGGGVAPSLTVSTTAVNQTKPEGSSIDIPVTVKNEFDQDAVGAVITIVETIPGGSSTSATAMFSTGAFVFPVLLTDGPGDYQYSISATNNGITSNTIQLTLTASGVTTSISMPSASASGNAQSGPGAGTLVGVSIAGAATLPLALTVTVVDQNNQPVDGATVTFTLSQAFSGTGVMQEVPTPADPTAVSFTLTPIVGTTVTTTTDSQGQAGIYLVPGVGPTTGGNTIVVDATFNGLTAVGLQFTATGTP